MKRALLCLVLVGLAGCGKSVCQRTCDNSKQQLTRDFGVLASYDCHNAKLEAIATCNACEAEFKTEFGLHFHGGCPLSVAEHPQLEP